ncbi:mechanosensitive ion channel family protein [Formosa sp. 3Alg 14/1]|uniref:mechanosensitive ion channel family protein n=1 Tax=unclassified Formosa TaxID=2644710 RepID=UPI0039BE85F0
MNTEINFNLLDKLLENIYTFLPKVVFGILFIIMSWLLLKLVLFVVKKSLKFARIETLTKKINELPLLDSAIQIKPEKIILVFVKLFLILVFIIIGAEILNLSLVSHEIGKLINYLPKFFSALVILIFGLFGANYLKKTVQTFLKAVDINGSKGISSIVFIIVFLMVAIMALNQAGFNTDVITSNLLLILGTIMVSFAIAFGLGAKDVIYRLLLGFYSKRNYHVGQRIVLDDKEGVVFSMDNISITIKFQDKKVVYPVKYIANNKIEIID